MSQSECRHAEPVSFISCVVVNPNILASLHFPLTPELPVSTSSHVFCAALSFAESDDNSGTANGTTSGAAAALKTR